MIKIKRSQLKILAKNRFGVEDVESQNKILIMISVSLAARTSYTVVGEEKGLDYEALIGLHDRLIAYDPPHSSPLEHCARTMGEVEYTGSKSSGKSVRGGNVYPEYGWCNNFKGFVPYRYIVDNKVK